MLRNMVQPGGPAACDVNAQAQGTALAQFAGDVTALGGLQGGAMKQGPMMGGPMMGGPMGPMMGGPMG